MPAFFTVFLTLKLCPGGAAAGGSVHRGHHQVRQGEHGDPLRGPLAIIALRRLQISAGPSARPEGNRHRRESPGAMATITTEEKLAVAGRTGTIWTPFRSFVAVFLSKLSENVVVDAGASAAPPFLIVAVTAKPSPGSADEGEFVSAVTFRSGRLAASTAPGLPRSRPATARAQPNRPYRIVPESLMTAPRRAANFVPRNQ